MKIKWLILITVLTATVAFWGCGGSNATGPASGSELEGTWRYTEPDWRLTFTFTGSNWTAVEEEWFKQDTTSTWTGTFTLNTTVVPKHIDLLCSSSPIPGEVGQTVLGIYALNSTAVACTIATADFGDTARPIVFGPDPLILLKQ